MCPRDYVGMCVALSIAVAVVGRGTPRAGVLFAASAGLLWAALDTSIKALSDDLVEGIAVLLHPLALVIAPVGVAARLPAFALVIRAAGLTPAPVRAARIEPV